MNKRKLFLTLGSIATVVAPLSVAAGCGTPSTKMGDVESKFLADIQSNEGKQRIDNLWMDKVLSTIFNKNNKNELTTIKDEYKTLFDWNEKTTIGDHIAQQYDDIVKHISESLLRNKIETDPDFLIKLAGQIMSIRRDDTTKGKLNTWNMYTSFVGNAPAKGFFDPELIDLLNAKGDYKIMSKIGFSNEVKKVIITKAYMSITREQWEKVFVTDEENRKLSDVEKIVDKGADFVYNKEAIDKHYSVQWKISLNETKSYDLLFADDLSVSDMKNEMKITGTHLGENAPWSTQHKKADPETVFKKEVVTAGKAVGVNLDLIGYQGYKELSNNEKDPNLDFRVEGWDKRGKDKELENPGFIQNGKLINNLETDTTEVVNYGLKNGNKTANVTYVVPILPEKTDKGWSLNTRDFNHDALSTVFYLNNTGLYTEAVKYFTKKENPIQLEIKDDYIKNILKDAGISYIKE